MVVLSIRLYMPGPHNVSSHSAGQIFTSTAFLLSKPSMPTSSSPGTVSATLPPSLDHAKESPPPPPQAPPAVAPNTLFQETIITIKKDWVKCVLLSLFITATAIAISVVIAYGLLVNDVNYTIPARQGKSDVSAVSSTLLSFLDALAPFRFDWMLTCWLPTQLLGH